MYIPSTALPFLSLTVIVEVFPELYWTVTSLALIVVGILRTVTVPFALVLTIFTVSLFDAVNT